MDFKAIILIIAQNAPLLLNLGEQIVAELKKTESGAAKLLEVFKLFEGVKIEPAQNSTINQ